MKNLILLLALSLLGTQLSAQGATSTTIYVDFDVVQSASAAGTLAEPYGDIVQAIADAAANAAAMATAASPVTGEVIIKDKTYDISRAFLIPTAATEIAPVVVKPQSTYGVTINFDDRRLFVLQGTSRYLTFEGLELYGKADLADFWTVVAKDLWAPDGNPVGVGGLAFILDGEYLTIKDNYIHHFYQKAVEINDGRHLVIEGNIIDAIATNSLSGGHGIMRQQVGQEFKTDDDDGVYRWDIYGNAIFNVEQRIYSWVPNKGFMEMVIDEGKSILIDDPKDTDGMQEEMSARIAHNIVAFGVVDHLRLKATPNLEVSNNSVFSTDEFADGITDKIGDENSLGNPSPATFVGFKCLNNAVQMPSNRPRWAYELRDAQEQGEGTAGFEVSGNYAGGNSRTNRFENSGVNVESYDLFTNAPGGDFSLSSSVPAGTNIGVDPAILTELGTRAAGFGVTISDDPWKTDDLLLTQTIMDNMPDVYDNNPGNEPVMSNYGTIHFETEMPAEGGIDTVEIDVTAPIVDETFWRGERIRSDDITEEKFVFGPIYTAWYLGVLRLPVVDAASYDRLRYGDVYVQQEFITPNDWLTVVEVDDASTSTLMDHYENDFTTGGDLLVRFDDAYTPSVGDSWVIASAGTVNSPAVARGASAQDFFGQVLISGAGAASLTMEEIELTVVPDGSGEDLVLSIIEPLPVELVFFSGEAISKTENRLRWETAREVDNDFFEVQRSADGLNWTVLGEVAAASNAAGGSAYGFSDFAPLADVNFYRLRQVDFDGTSELSPIVQINGLDAGRRPAAFPNPFNEEFVIPVGIPVEQFAIYTAEGREITGEVSHSIENGRITVRGGHLPAGSYIVRYNEETTVVIKK